MIELIKNNAGYIEAVIEWLLFNEHCLLDNNGEFLVVCELEISKGLNGYKILKEFSKIILEKAPSAKRCFFVREYKYKGRKPREYTREQFEQFIGA